MILRFILRYIVIAVIISIIVGICSYRYHRAKEKVKDDGVSGLIIDVLSRICNLGICILIVRFAIKAIME